MNMTIPNTKSNTLKIKKVTIVIESYNTKESYFYEVPHSGFLAFCVFR